LVKPAANPVVAGVSNEVREAADVFVFARFQPIAPDNLHGAFLAIIRREPKKQPRRVIVAFARALVERATDGQFDVPPPPRASGKRQGRYRHAETASRGGAVMGFEPH